MGMNLINLMLDAEGHILTFRRLDPAEAIVTVHEDPGAPGEVTDDDRRPFYGPFRPYSLPPPIDELQVREYDEGNDEILATEAGLPPSPAFHVPQRMFEDDEIDRDDDESRRQAEILSTEA